MTANRIIRGNKRNAGFSCRCTAVGVVSDCLPDDWERDALDALAFLRRHDPVAYHRVVDDLQEAAAEERAAVLQRTPRK